MRTHLQNMRTYAHSVAKHLRGYALNLQNTLNYGGDAHSLAERLKEKLRTDRSYSLQGLGSGFEFDALRVQTLSY